MLQLDFVEYNILLYCIKIFNVFLHMLGTYHTSDNISFSYNVFCSKFIWCFDSRCWIMKFHILPNKKYVIKQPKLNHDFPLLQFTEKYDCYLNSFKIIRTYDNIIYFGVSTLIVSVSLLKVMKMKKTQCFFIIFHASEILWLFSFQFIHFR